jgi:hypothetical protein
VIKLKGAQQIVVNFLLSTKEKDIYWQVRQEFEEQKN